MLVESIGIGLGAAALLLGLGTLGLELSYRRRPGNRLEMLSRDWQLDVYEPQQYRLVGEVELVNQTRSLEIMVPELQAELCLLSKGSLAEVTHTIRVVPQHPEEPARTDDYWFAYIVKIGKSTRAQITVDIQGPDLSELQVAWVKIHYIAYGPQGRIPKTHHVVVPLRFPPPLTDLRWRSTPEADVLPIPTHLLTQLDDPVAVVQRYVLPHTQPGDIVTIGETPIAIMQGRFYHPTQIQPGWLAKRLCYFFKPTSSLATACGLQSLVDIVGPWRVLFAFVVGSLAKIVGQAGVFYRLAGEQARLIDDVTGTLPPYDQFIVLGPERPQQVVNQIQQATGLSAAIVDVNDLKAVKILAATSDLSSTFLKHALITNPAGNGNEQTPVVLIRPKK